MACSEQTPQRPSVSEDVTMLVGSLIEVIDLHFQIESTLPDQESA